jgi:hypothetical protein
MLTKRRMKGSTSRAKRFGKDRSPAGKTRKRHGHDQAPSDQSHREQEDTDHTVAHTAVDFGDRADEFLGRGRTAAGRIRRAYHDLEQLIDGGAAEEEAKAKGE